MLGKRPRPLIGKLSELLVSSHRAGAGTFNLPTTTSPKTPLDYRIQSPRSGMKNFDLGGVGLGIVAALEKSSNGYAICSSKLKSNPIPVVSGHRRPEEEMEIDSLDENYTYVTCHGPNNKTFTKVYYDGENISTSTDHDQKLVNPNHGGGGPVVLHKRCDDDIFPTSDFLSSCDLCSKKLHGKDIYMYRGEKAFCSTECRSRQIMIDERKERRRLEDVVSSSPCTSSTSRDNQNIFSTGILAI